MGHGQYEAGQRGEKPGRQSRPSYRALTRSYCRANSSGMQVREMRGVRFSLGARHCEERRLRQSNLAHGWDCFANDARNDRMPLCLGTVRPRIETHPLPFCGLTPARPRDMLY
jgi:hypothetical protein